MEITFTVDLFYVSVSGLVVILFIYAGYRVNLEHLRYPLDPTCMGHLHNVSVIGLIKVLVAHLSSQALKWI